MSRPPRGGAGFYSGLGAERCCAVCPVGGGAAASLCPAATARGRPDAIGLDRPRSAAAERLRKISGEEAVPKQCARPTATITNARGQR